MAESSSVSGCDRPPAPRRWALASYRWVAVLFLAGVVVEFFLAGLGVFRTQHEATKAGSILTKSGFNHSFDPHLVLGDVLFAVGLVLCVAAFAARIGRKARLTSGALFVLLVVQAALAFAGPAAVRALHPVLGLLVLCAAVHCPQRPPRRGNPRSKRPLSRFDDVFVASRRARILRNAARWPARWRGRLVPFRPVEAVGAVTKVVASPKRGTGESGGSRDSCRGPR